MATFHTLRIKEIYKETSDCSVISFDVPSHLHQEFAFRQGQHLTLKAIIDGKDTRRSYSLCSAPTEGAWKVAVKQILGGAFSTFVNEELKTGDSLDVMAPSGAFGVAVSPEEQKNYLFFAAGSGITPVLSMIKAHLSAEPQAT
nr:phenylacetic acid degradation protein [Bacteroidota bacterium]